jgi:hypothetical protein
MNKQIKQDKLFKYTLWFRKILLYLQHEVQSDYHIIILYVRGECW